MAGNLITCIKMRHKSEWERFWGKVIVTDDGCWRWLGSRVQSGYGKFGLQGGKIVAAHRWAYEKCIGRIPHGLDLDHLCRNTGCVNPLHLQPVTRQINLLRSPFTQAHIRAKKKVCVRGHPLTEGFYTLDRYGPESARLAGKFIRKIENKN